MATIAEQARRDLVSRYKEYLGILSGIYEDYCFQQHFLPYLHSKIKTGELHSFKIKSIVTKKTFNNYRTDWIYGIISRQKDISLAEHTLTKAVGITENFLQQIASRVYYDYPDLMNSNHNTVDTQQQEKLLNIILQSADKKEILSKIAEEKIRGIFYGDPTDFFTKDKAKLGFKNYFKDHYDLAIKEYKTIIAYRNIIMHNNGRIDNKFIREIKGTTYKEGQKIHISSQYIFDSLFLLNGLSLITLNSVLDNRYKLPLITSKYTKRIQIFENEYLNK